MPSFPAVAARELGLSRVPLLCTREVPVPGIAAARGAHAAALLRRGGPRAQARLPRTRRACSGPTSIPPSSLETMSLEFAEKTRRIPVYPVAAGYSLGTDVAMLASNEVGLRPAGAGGRGGATRGDRRQPLPRPLLHAAAPGRCPIATACPGERVALGTGSCDLLLAAGDALLEPGAELVYAWPSFSIYPHLAAASGARAIEVPLTADAVHDLDAIAAEVTVATRLVLICNPNNPTEHRSSARGDRGVPGRRSPITSA